MEGRGAGASDSAGGEGGDGGQGTGDRGQETGVRRQETGDSKALSRAAAIGDGGSVCGAGRSGPVRPTLSHPRGTAHGVCLLRWEQRGRQAGADVESSGGAGRSGPERPTLSTGKMPVPREGNGTRSVPTTLGD